MITVQPYINKLEALKIWIQMRVDERHLRRWTTEIFFETGVFLSPIFECPDFEIWYEERKKAIEENGTSHSVFIQTLKGLEVKAPKQKFLINGIDHRDFDWNSI